MSEADFAELRRLIVDDDEHRHRVDLVNMAVPPTQPQDARSAIAMVYGSTVTSAYEDTNASSSSFRPTNSQTGTFDGGASNDAFSTRSMQFAPNLESCLAVNLAYQDILERFSGQTENSLQRVKEQTRAVGSSLDKPRAVATSSNSRKQQKVPVLQYMPPYFKDAAGMAPPINTDKKRKIDTGEFDSLVQPPKKWTHAECVKLVNAVKEEIVAVKLQPLQSKSELLNDKIKRSQENMQMEVTENLKKELVKTETNMNRINNLPPDHILGENCKEIDWMKIAVGDFAGARRARECELKWMNELSPQWSQGTKWTKAEKEQLARLAQQNTQHTDWSSVAQQLGTRRTAFQCFEVYQSCLNARMVNKANWTSEEDEQLLQIVDMVRDGEFIPWDQVAYYMEGRTRTQCQTRYNRTLDHTIKRGRWKEEEDLLLMVAVKKYGKQNWKKIALMVPGRTDAQCRERWAQALDDSNSMSDWTNVEDEKLIAAVKTFGHKNWAVVANVLPGRNNKSCKLRYRELIGGNLKPLKPKQMKGVARPTAAVKAEEAAPVDRRRTLRSSSHLSPTNADASPPPSTSTATITYVDDDEHLELLDSDEEFRTLDSDDDEEMVPQRDDDAPSADMTATETTANDEAAQRRHRNDRRRERVKSLFSQIALEVLPKYQLHATEDQRRTTTNEQTKQVKEFLDAIPKDMRTLIASKLKAIEQKYRSSRAVVRSVTASESTALKPMSKQKLMRINAEKAIKEHAREAQMLSAVEDELALLLAKNDSVDPPLSENDKRKRNHLTKQLIMQVLSFTDEDGIAKGNLSPFPPSKATIQGFSKTVDKLNQIAKLHKKNDTAEESVVATDLMDQVKDTIYYKQLKSRVDALFVWASIVASTAPLDQSNNDI